MRFVAGAILLVSAVSLVGQTPSRGNPDDGKKIFASVGCYECHGYAGQGGAGARLAPRPIPFEAFTKYVRKPLEQMPPYTPKVLSDKELADIYAFLLSIPLPPSVNSIPILITPLRLDHRIQ